MKTTIKNQSALYLFCGLIGAFAGAIVWVFLKILSLGTTFLWHWLPEKTSLFILPFLICVMGSFLIGLFRKKYGDYPEELDVVLKKIKTDKHYAYDQMLVILLAALFPLLIGASVGPEAGLTGIIVALCYWAGDNLKFAHASAKEYTAVGTAVSLGVLFHSPLFGIFAVEETEDTPIASLSKSSKLLIYGISIAAATSVYSFLGSLFGKGLGGFPSFSFVELRGIDYVLLIPYILVGIILAFFYELTHKLIHKNRTLIPPVFRETVAGILLGITALTAPLLLFSGEEEMAELMVAYGEFVPLLLIVYAFWKILLTNICIGFGLKGGHFFPLIFSGMLMGYGVALLLVGDGGHEVFAAAVVTASLLGGVMKKPLAVTLLLFLCFPMRMGIWILLAAIISGKSMPFLTKGSPE